MNELEDEADMWLQQIWQLKLWQIDKSVVLNGTSNLLDIR